MIENAENKMVDGKTAKNKAVIQSFFFPEHTITIEATSLAEAQEKLKETLKAINKK